MGTLHHINQLPAIAWDALPLLLDEREAAEALNVSTSYLRKSRSEGAREGRTAPPPFVKVDGSIYYRPQDLRAWAENLQAKIAV